MGRTAQGIKQRLSAIRYAHIATGHPDPLQGRARLWASLQGLARWESAPVRKVPVTPSMLRWIQRYLEQNTAAACEKAATWAAICTGWFFMLRASEYLPPVDPKVIRGCDLTFYHEGTVVSLFFLRLHSTVCTPHAPRGRREGCLASASSRTRPSGTSSAPVGCAGARQAGSVSLQLREAKIDQFQRGQIRTHHSTGEPICPVEALK